MKGVKTFIFEFQDRDGKTILLRSVGFPHELSAEYLDREIAKMLLKMAAEEN